MISLEKFILYLMKNVIWRPILESKGMCVIFQKKGKKGQKGTTYLKIWQKCKKFENVLEKGSLMCATITLMKQLEYALYILLADQISLSGSLYFLGCWAICVLQVFVNQAVTLWIFEINLVSLIKSFFYMAKMSKQNSWGWNELLR